MSSTLFVITQSGLESVPIDSDQRVFAEETIVDGETMYPIYAEDAFSYGRNEDLHFLGEYSNEITAMRIIEEITQARASRKNYYKMPMTKHMRL